MTDLVLREDCDGVARLTLNRPDKLNALNVELFAQLESHVERLALETDAVGCVVLAGAGRCFSAGHDLGDIASGEKLPRPNFQASVIERLADLPQPVVSAVHSHCYTGALELALAGDIILAAPDARFADTHAKWALTPIWGMSQRLVRRVGRHKALEMMLTARTVEAAEAERIGLANAVLDGGDFVAAVHDWCRAMLTNSWFSLRANKKLVRETDGMALAEGLGHEIYRNEGVGPDMARRIAAFNRK